MIINYPSAIVSNFVIKLLNVILTKQRKIYKCLLIQM